MEFASEMLIKAKRKNLRIKEVNISYHPRIGETKLSSFSDGWRHLKMLLLYAPKYTFLVPGIILFILGWFLIISLMFGSLNLFGLKLDIHPIILGSALALTGYQLILLWLYAKTFGITHLNEQDKFVETLHRTINLEKSISLGILFLFIGCVIAITIIIRWLNSDFGALNAIKIGMLVLTLLLMGIQTISAGFMLSILGNKR